MFVAFFVVVIWDISFYFVLDYFLVEELDSESMFITSYNMYRFLLSFLDHKSCFDVGFV
jgi:hypothetical protein